MSAPIHPDTPFSSSGNHMGWALCRECVRRKNFSHSETIRTQRFTNYKIWLLVREWRERIYTEMWEDWVKTSVINLKE